MGTMEVYQPQERAASFMPVMSAELVIQRKQEVMAFVGKMMKENEDYGAIPGTGNKKTLLKGGAEKLCTFFGLTPRPVIVEKVTDWTGAQTGGEPFFYFLYRIGLWRDNLLIAEADGSCNTFESKYRYRNAERVCPSCGKPCIIKGKEEYGGGFICFFKKGGCGAKFEDDDPAILKQTVGKVVNPDVADMVNTIQKMAQKRALIAAALLAFNLSDYFTQDVDQSDEETQQTATSPAQTARQSQPAQQQPRRQAAPQQAREEDGPPPLGSSAPPANVDTATGEIKEEAQTAAPKATFEELRATFRERAARFGYTDKSITVLMQELLGEEGMPTDGKPNRSTYAGCAALPDEAWEAACGAIAAKMETAGQAVDAEPQKTLQEWAEEFQKRADSIGFTGSCKSLMSALLGKPIGTPSDLDFKIALALGDDAWQRAAARILEQEAVAQ